MTETQWNANSSKGFLPTAKENWQVMWSDRKSANRARWGIACGIATIALVSTYEAMLDQGTAIQQDVTICNQESDEPITSVSCIGKIINDVLDSTIWTLNPYDDN